MKPNNVVVLLFLYLGYLGYQAYDFFSSPSSELGQARQNLETLKASVVEKQKKVAESEEFFRTLDAKRAELRALSEKLMTMKATLSDSIDIPAFMKLLITEAQRIGLQLTSLTPAAQGTQPFYLEQPMDITYSGVFIQLIAYLDRLAQSTRIIRVEDIQIRPMMAAGQKKPKKFTEVNGVIRVKTFFYRPTKEDDVAASGGSTPGATGAGSAAAGGAAQTGAPQ